VRFHGEKAAFDFKPKSHVELCESLKLVDFARATKLSGSGFLLYTNWGARLERALIQMLLDLHIHEHGYTEVSPPFVSGRNVSKASASFQNSRTSITAWFEGDKTAELGKLYLVPDRRNAGGEHSSRGNSQGKPVADLLLRLHAVFSRRGGRGGRGHARHDSRASVRQGRVDQNREAEHGYEEQEKMVANAEKVLQLLGLHYRVVLLCTGDMGFASAKTYDIEVWAPGQGSYLEVSSVSNCEDFQARRMNLRFKTGTAKTNFRTS